MENKSLTHDDLNLFTGDLERFRHWLCRRVIYTPGVHYLTERGQAHWLLDAIAFYFRSNVMVRAIERDKRVKVMQFWRLEVRSDRSAILTARADSDEEPFISQSFRHTDFPLHCVHIWAAYDGEYWTLYLPSEH